MELRNGPAEFLRGRCEAFDSAFRVDIFDIVAGWR